MAGHFDHAACLEVDVFVVFRCSDGFDSFYVGGFHSFEAVAQRFQFGRDFSSFVCFDLMQICAGGDAANSCHDLQLGGSFVDRSDAGIAVDAFASVVFHETGPSVYLHAVIGVLIAEFAGHAFRHRGECVGQFLVGFHFGTFFGFERAFFGNVFVCFVHVYESCRFVKQRA